LVKIKGLFGAAAGMPYDDFSLETASSILGVSAGPADLFPHVEPVPVPAWLREMLDRGMRRLRFQMGVCP
jgi:hypothetical protein